MSDPQSWNPAFCCPTCGKFLRPSEICSCSRLDNEEEFERTGIRSMLTIEEAKLKHVCRICGEHAGPRRLGPTAVDSFVYDYGREHAHACCLGRPPTEVWPGFPKAAIVVTDAKPFRFRCCNHWQTTWREDIWCKFCGKEFERNHATQ